jgi:multiple sugar transport system ATP-binding protein
VALARAIVREPTVFLLDEPLSNLDAKLRTSAREELEQFHARVKTTTIYVTHDQVEAMALGDRVVVLHQGVVRQIGTPKEVYDDPADTFVATFLGSPAMNLIPQEHDIVGFRPEHLLPASLISPDQRVSMHFHFSHEEYLGAERILYGSLADKRFEAKDVISRLPSRVEASFAPGSIVEFAVPRNELKFFDRATEKRSAPRVISWQ